MINATIAKSEFGSKNQLLLLGERELATGKMFWVVVVQLVPEQGPGSQGGSIQQFCFRSHRSSTIEEKWQEIKILRRKFCRTNITSSVGLINFFHSINV